MKLFKLASFKKDESGAVTVDWVVLTAAVVGLALLVIGLVRTGLEAAGGQIADELETSLANARDGGGDTGGGTPAP